MALTLWFDEITDHRLSGEELIELQRRAECLYQCNTHIFEDRLDALAALGAVPFTKHLAMLGGCG